MTIGWCPFCSAPIYRLTTTDGRGHCTWGHGLVWPVGLSRGGEVVTGPEQHAATEHVSGLADDLEHALDLLRAYTFGETVDLGDAHETELHAHGVLDELVALAGGGREYEAQREYADEQYRKALAAEARADELQRERDEELRGNWKAEPDEAYGSSETYWLRNKLRSAVVHLRDIEDFYRVRGGLRELHNIERADRARSIYEQITEDFINGKLGRPTVQQQAEQARREADQLRAEILRQIGLYDMSANDHAGLSAEETVEAIRAALAGVQAEKQQPPHVICTCRDCVQADLPNWRTEPERGPLQADNKDSA